jgi:hypothetical protein
MNRLALIALALAACGGSARFTGVAETLTVKRGVITATAATLSTAGDLRGVYNLVGRSKVDGLIVSVEPSTIDTSVEGNGSKVFSVFVDATNSATSGTVEIIGTYRKDPTLTALRSIAVTVE